MPKFQCLYSNGVISAGRERRRDRIRIYLDLQSSMRNSLITKRREYARIKTADVVSSIQIAPTAMASPFLLAGLSRFTMTPSGGGQEGPSKYAWMTAETSRFTDIMMVQVSCWILVRGIKFKTQAMKWAN